MSEVVTGAWDHLTNQTTLHVDFGERPRLGPVVRYCSAIAAEPLFTHEKECCDKHCYRRFRNGSETIQRYEQARDDRAAGEEPGDSLLSEQPDCDYIRPLQH